MLSVYSFNMDCSRCVSKDAEIALLKEQLADRDATIVEHKNTITLLRALVPSSADNESMSAAPTSDEFIKREAPFDDEHLGRDDEEEREAQLVAALPPFNSTFVNSATLLSLLF